MSGTKYSVFASSLLESRVQDSRLILYYLAQLCHAAVQNVSICCQRAALSQMAPSKAALLCRLACSCLSGSAHWFFTAMWCLQMHFSKSRTRKPVQAMIFNTSHIHSHSSAVDFCSNSVREPISWYFTYFSVYKGDISIARYRLPSEEQVQALGSLLLKAS